ncbi:gamma-mobile-trio protein GmtX [Methylophaga marina]|uniref:gamma-mobile-trio protein GmtX n=1 Tax=Methylophaga marina TaxID=45495 RepID=UPI002573DF45|nr:gamma-mobile-trio protein GmtX [Methylophaga marina]
MTKKLKQTASKKVCKTLDSIYEICIEQTQRGMYDFSVATISRLGYKRGVPKAQSLRNQSGEQYRALLNSFEEQHHGDKPRLESKSKDDWIEEIQNPKHKLLARIQASELAAANKKLREFIPPGSRIEVRDYQNSTLDEDHKLTKLERRALEYIISEEFLGKWGFSISEYGEIVDGNSKVVLKAATVDAVNKALNNI